MLWKTAIGIGIVAILLVVGAYILWSADLLAGLQGDDNTIGGYGEFVDALRNEGAQVEPQEAVKQPFFDISGTVVLVNGNQVQVFDFGEENFQRAASEQISADGFTIGATAVDWVDQPNFWAKDRIIVLYVGRDQETIALLNRFLGEPITEGVMLPPGDPPYAAVAAEVQLGEMLGLPVEEIDLVSFERVEWPDACLGLAGPGEMCAEVLTSGWRLVLRAGAQEYEAHADLPGKDLRWKQGVEPVRACTEMGCYSGLTIQLQGTIPEAFAVEVSIPGDEPVRVECPQGGDPLYCESDRLFLAERTPEVLTVRVSWEDNDVVASFQPNYETVRPNGPDCPPECRQAEVTLDLSK
jgi:hypothetical protein